MQRVLLLVNKKVGEMEHYAVPLPPLEYGPAFTAGERVLITKKTFLPVLPLFVLRLSAIE